MPAQLVNVSKSNLPPLPTPEEFLKDAKRGMESLIKASTDSVLFGDTFSDAVPQPEGSEKNQKGAYIAKQIFKKFATLKDGKQKIGMNK